MRSGTKASNVLPLASAVTCALYHALTLFLCIHLAGDSGHLASYVAVYSLGGFAFGIFGVIGILKKQNDAVGLFAQFLFVDALISVICRMLLQELFMKSLYATDVCGDAFDDEHWSSLNPGYGNVASLRWETKFKQLFSSSGHCNLALSALHCIAIGAMLLTSVAQISLALLMQNYGKLLQERSRYALWTIVEVDEKLAEEYF